MACDDEKFKILFNLYLPTDIKTPKLNTSPKKEAIETFEIPDDCLLLQHPPPLPPDIENKESVPDVFDEFSDVVDTELFKQPFSVRKYKHLIPKVKSRRKTSTAKEQMSSPSKRNSHCKNIESSKFLHDSPCSPSLSIDSAIDLSADNYQVEFPIIHDSSEPHHHHNYKSCNSPKKFIFEPSGGRLPPITSIENDFQINKNNMTNRSSTKRKRSKMPTLYEEDELIKIISKKPKKEENSTLTLFDILCSNLSIPIPINVIKDNKIKICIDKQTQVDNTVSNYNNNAEIEPKILIPFNINYKEIGEILQAYESSCCITDYNENIPIIRHCGNDVTDQDDVNPEVYENFTDTLANLFCGKSSECLSNETENKVYTILNNDLNDSTINVITLPDNIAVRTLQFIVDDDSGKLPENLVEELLFYSVQNEQNLDSVEEKSNLVSMEEESSLDSVEEKSNLDSVEEESSLDSVEEESSLEVNTGTTNDNNTKSENFHLNMLRMYCAGIIEKDEKTFRIENKCFQSMLCAKRICNKYRQFRINKSLKNDLQNTVAIDSVEEEARYQSQESPNPTPVLKRRFKYANILSRN